MEETLFPLLAVSRLRMEIDGEGVTTLVSGAGCLLKCRYCINKRMLEAGKAKNVTAGELFEQVKCDDLYFKATGGGVTFGGGESLLHASFIAAFRKLCPKEWSINAETSLAVPRESVCTALDAVDGFIVDCKSMDGTVYREYTGGDIGLMRDNLEFLVKNAGPERIKVRVPAIPGITGADDQKRDAGILRSMGVTRLDLFDYVIKKTG